MVGLDEPRASHVACPCILTWALTVASIKKILNLNAVADTNENDDLSGPQQHDPSASILTADGEPIWKVLVFDDLGRDVISSVLRVNDLRTLGVTMYMSVAPKHRVPDETTPGRTKH